MKRIYLVLGAILLASSAGYWAGQRTHTGAQTSAAIAQLSAAAYVCPMHSHIVQDHTGVCPICGMNLVPAKVGQAAASNQIHVDSATQQQLGVRLATAQRMRLAQPVRTYGTLVVDDNTLYRVTPTVEGVLVKLHANRPGRRFAAGETLYEIHSQELLQLQNEYVDFLKRRGQTLQSIEQTRAQNLRARDNVSDQDAASREQSERAYRQSEEQLQSMLIPAERDGARLAARLKYAGFNAAMLDRLATSRQALVVAPVAAPRDCVVKEVNARAGMTLNAMSEIVSCVDVGSAWLEVALYPDQVQWVRDGDPFTAYFDDGSELKGRLTGINPLVDPVSRTVRARIPVQMKDRVIGGYAAVTIEALPREEIAIPRDAVLRTGHGDYVLRAREKGHFSQTKVQTGIETDDLVAIHAGLAPGDQVVVNGQFLLDSAASFAAAAQRYGSADRHTR
jgi:Cu(I)/Ag(I) efflux system membrane fusion protein